MENRATLLFEKAERLYLLISRTYAEQFDRLSGMSTWYDGCDIDKMKWKGSGDYRRFEEMKMLTFFYFPHLESFILEASRLDGDISDLFDHLGNFEKLASLPITFNSVIQKFSDWKYSFHDALADSVRTEFRSLVRSGAE